ncbi:pyridoxine kinase [Albimonas donghaensis]|uniref:pyridoxal kinase n=1 Tax=Albimonas donghaensis TaxID=356660 RepID=A0A1H2RK38_9RHOB|nr:pyridoxal kinase [Albimonas donghaensis]SDW19737.1 pyridoxine kinase [Albimonas donghaensis]
MSAPTCLSIQSAVVAGHVGHGASSFALGASGVEVWPLPTVTLSGHARTPGVKGRRATGAEIAALGEGLAAGGALARCDGLLTGYLGTAEAAEAVADIAEALRAARPGAIVLCDPVLGDEGPGLYLPPEIGTVYRERLLPLADIAVPNRFELGWLTGLPCGDLAETRAAAEALRATGPGVVHVTSVPGPEGGLGILTVTGQGAGQGAWLATAPRADLHVNGAGDFVAALLMAGALTGRPAQEAAARAVGAAHVLAVEALRTGRDDLPVIAAQAAWRDAAPARSVPLG